jgi:hypothetical protein
MPAGFDAANAKAQKLAVDFRANILRTPITRWQWELLKNTPVESVRWSARATYALEGAQCKNLGDVFSIPKQDWAAMRNVGKTYPAEGARWNEPWPCGFVPQEPWPEKLPQPDARLSTQDCIISLVLFSVHAQGNHRM